MQFLALLLALAAAVSAQSLADLPSCATSCVRAGLPSDCNLDPKCICSSSSFIEAISCCVSKSCDVTDQEATLQFAQGICNPVGVTNLPTAATCTGAAATASGTASGTRTAASGSITSTSSATGSVAQSASSAVSSLSSSLSAASSSASEAGSSESSSAAAAATSGGAAAALNAQGLGAVGAGLLGLAAML